MVKRKLYLLLLLWLANTKCFSQSGNTFNTAFDFDSLYENGSSAIELKDGYLFSTLSSTAFASSDKRVFIKTDFNGEKIFQKDLYFSNILNYGGKIIYTNDSNLILVGSVHNTSLSKSYFQLIKLTINGDTLFTKIYQNFNLNSGQDIVQSSDSGFVMIGWTQNSGSSTQIGFVKTDKNGIEISKKTYGGSGKEDAFSLIELEDKGFFIVGYTYSYGAGDRDCYLIRTDSLGNKLWQKTYGTSGDEGGAGITKTRDGNFVITGWKEDGKYGGFSIHRKWIFKIDPNGNVIWEKTYGQGDNSDLFKNIYQLFDGSFVVIGGEKSYLNDVNKGIISRISSKGDLLWERVYHKGMPTGDNYFYDLKATSDGGYIVAGTSRDSATFQDAWVLKLDCFGCDGELCNFGDSLCTYEDTGVFVPEYNLNNEAFLGQNYPNPFDQTTTITYHLPENISKASIRIYDLIGNVAQEYSVSNKSNRLIISSSDLPSGIYVYSLMIGDEEKQFKKMLINR